MNITTLIDPAAGVAVLGPQGPRFEEILTPAALAFLADLHRNFDKRRRELLERRMARQKLFDAGETPDFLAETREIRQSDWQVAPIPADLLDRRVEITGPVDRKMIVNALNSGAKVFMADFEDATSPRYSNMIEGQLNLRDRWAGRIDFTDSGNGKSYKLSADPAVLMVRPRGWHLPERHVTVDGEEISGALFDFGLYVFHNAKAQIALGATPAFYLPKLESHLEARLWNEVFLFAQERLAVPAGTFKATVLIETLPAAFEMDEIIYELRAHMAGLNCGRWDYIFSYIKRLGKNARYLTPDRAAMTMGKAFLASYSLLLIKTCHRRGAVPLYNLMEDAATAEISRAQIWQWLKLGASLDDGRVVSPDLFRSIFADEMEEVRKSVGAAYETGRFGEATQLFCEMSLSPQFEEFLTLPAYRLLE